MVKYIFFTVLGWILNLLKPLQIFFYLIPQWIHQKLCASKDVDMKKGKFNNILFTCEEDIKKPERLLTQSAGAEEYTDCISKGERFPQQRVS